MCGKRKLRSRTTFRSSIDSLPIHPYNSDMRLFILAAAALLCSCSTLQTKRTVNSRIREHVRGMEKLSEDSPTGLNIGGKAYTVFSRNSGTGYDWHYTISDKTVITNISTEVFRSSYEGNRTGAPLKKVWVFQALKKGKTEILFKYHQSWDDKNIDKTRKFVITVE